MKRKIYVALSIFFGMGTIGFVFDSKKIIDQLGFQQFISQIIFSSVFTFLFYWLYIKDSKKAIAVNSNRDTINKPIDEIYSSTSSIEIPISVIEEERNKIKLNKFKRKNNEILKFIVAFFIPWIGWIYLIYRLVRYNMKKHYFLSDEFIRNKIQIDSFVTEYNEIAKYVEKFDEVSLQSTSFDKYKYAHVAKGQNTSSSDLQRDRNVIDYQSKYVYNASLQVVRNAELEPFKYLCKYFDFKPNEENLQRIQEIGEQVSRFLNAKENLDNRLARILNSLNPPQFILKYYKEEFLYYINIEVPQINFNFPTYTFQYVSAGGNSSQVTSITLNEEIIELLITYMDEQVKYKKSAKAQRALMTKKLREYVKERDCYTCQYCGASTAQQDLLLLEVDHIIPVSKGGMSTESNLQTLCWKCNRTKSDKIL
ncbi:HNH endonuclease [Streptococcus pseudopneumoniae]|uniref:HNH endonuclease n=1 Tax=Streptococcus pseudopneumoniae TaxID=257758 RepID=UPI00110C2EE1|nr:HNH endonuclease [Streptococcus pseudopneumoniae]TMR54623.1 HNH endonuclease [Streptococcus pseudopneumoniae]